MIWQDLVFLVGNVFSLLVLVPTLRDEMANVPLGTALPSAFIGLVYGTAFLTLGMTLSAVGAVLTGLMWSLIAALRSPNRLSSSDEPDVEAADDADGESTAEVDPDDATAFEPVPAPRTNRSPHVADD